MDVSNSPIVERIARVLAGQRLSLNAGGDQPSAAADVDDAWPRYEKDALAVLKTMREPDGPMASAGDVRIWERMILAALGKSADPAPSYDPPEIGSDPLHEGP